MTYETFSLTLHPPPALMPPPHVGSLNRHYDIFQMSCLLWTTDDASSGIAANGNAAVVYAVALTGCSGRTIRYGRIVSRGDGRR